MEVVRIENFISKKESKILSNWILNNSHQPFFKNANMGGNRKTTRYSTNENFFYPEESLNIRKNINLNNYFDQSSGFIILLFIRSLLIFSISSCNLLSSCITSFITSFSII